MGVGEVLLDGNRVDNTPYIFVGRNGGKGKLHRAQGGGGHGQEKLAMLRAKCANEEHFGTAKMREGEPPKGVFLFQGMRRKEDGPNEFARR